ncbi:MAG: hypothetical protein LBH00_11015 [Planctomycetaceae bacterium]|jgi:hypothetical protein|nr:hypothetical protein [Planctomycetaceae bacterium]
MNDTMSVQNDTPLPEIPAKLKRFSVVHVLSGLLIIWFCLWFLSGMIGSFFDPHSQGLGILLYPLLFPLCLWGACKQYTVLFCRPVYRSRASHEVFFIIGGILIFEAVANVTEIKNWTGDAFCFLAGSFFAGFLLLVAGEVNRRIFRSRLAAAAACQRILENHDSTGMMRKWKYFLRQYKYRFFIGLFCMSAFVIGNTVWMVSAIVPVSGEHLSYEEFPYKHFPSAGTDFSYKRGDRGTIKAEFTISEQGFRDWIASETRWEYCRSLKDRNLDSRLRLPVTAEENCLDNDGLYAGWGNGKGGRAVFYRQTNRAYYWTYY